jgi:hypothetical protein
MIYLISLLFLLSGCEKKKPIPFTEDQKKAYAAFTTEERIIFDDCNSSGRMFAFCLADLRRKCQNQNESNITDTAVGTALGVGAVQLLMGK